MDSKSKILSWGVFDQNALGAWTKFSNHTKIAELVCMSAVAHENINVNVPNWDSGHLLFSEILEDCLPPSLFSYDCVVLSPPFINKCLHHLMHLIGLSGSST